MKFTMLSLSIFILSGCSTFIGVESHQTFTAEEIKQVSCAGGYKRVNQEYVSPKVENMSPEMKKAYLKCISE